MILSDKQIVKYADQGMIVPFSSELIKEVNGCKEISHGLSSFGYDISLSSKEFFVYDYLCNTDSWGEINPKKFDCEKLIPLHTEKDEFGEYFTMPPHSYGLGVASERLNLPENITGICVGKSTYARCGIICNLTPIEAGWQGYLTLELSNSTDYYCRVYANEGIAQIVFFEGENPDVSYATRNGKYQNQKQEVVLPRV